MRRIAWALAVVLGAVTACGSSGSHAGSTDGDAGSGSGGGSTHGDGSVGQFGGDGGRTECATPIEGCPCATAGQQATCWTGPPGGSGVGHCKPGTATCMQSAEFPTWGPCVGEVLDCGVVDAGHDVDAAPPPVSDSCRRLALAYGSANFPSTVCRLAPDGSLQCAVNPADSTAGGAGSVLLPSSTLSNLACISGGEDFFCAVTTAGGLVCWGDQGMFDPAHIGTGPLTGGTPIVNETLVIPGLQSVIDVSAGETHVCVLTASHGVVCWGNGAGEVNTGSWPLPPSPTAVDLGGPAVEIASGDGFSCALRSDGVVLCWGNDSTGQLGDGATSTGSATPLAVTGLPTKAVGVWADQATYPCALLQDGSVWCWGSALGASPTPPKQITGLTGTVTAITTGGEYAVACALMAAGDVQCWTPSTAPTQLAAPGSGILELRSIDYDYCGLLADGSVTCWYNQGIEGVSFTAPVTVPGL